MEKRGSLNLNVEKELNLIGVKKGLINLKICM